jgi:hypothetical protein
MSLIELKLVLETYNNKLNLPIIGNSIALRSSSVCSSGTGAKRLLVKVLKISVK